MSDDHARLMPVSEVADLLAVSERQVWKLNTSGRIPAPVRIGRSVRWKRQELLDWITAGTPSRDDWERSRAGPASKMSVMSIDSRRSVC